jgi:hypothetical protein
MDDNWSIGKYLRANLAAVYGNYSGIERELLLTTIWLQSPHNSVRSTGQANAILALSVFKILLTDNFPPKKSALAFPTHWFLNGCRGKKDPIVHCILICVC